MLRQNVGGILREFREFAIKGNALDLAIGLIIGAAFGAIVSSMVDDIIMPPIGWLLGGVDFSNIFVVLKYGQAAAPEGGYSSLAAAKAAGAVTWNIGLFINAIIKFLIVAFAVFLIVKAFNKLRRQIETEPEKVEATPLAPPREQVLLEEIRDLLKTQQTKAPSSRAKTAAAKADSA